MRYNYITISTSISKYILNNVRFINTIYIFVTISYIPFSITTAFSSSILLMPLLYIKL